MKKLSITMTTLLIVALLSWGCSSSGSDSEPGLDGNLSIEVMAPAESGFFLTYYSWDGNVGEFNSETIAVPESGTFTYNVSGSGFLGFGVILGPFGDIDGVRLSLLSDGEVIAETTTPQPDGAYELEVGNIPDELGAEVQ